MKMRRNLLLLLALVLLMSTVPVHAETMGFESNYLEFDVPEDVLVMTGKTQKYDPVWQQAGVTSPADKLKEFEDMSVVACLYDKKSGAMVNFISKRSSETVAKFNFLTMTDKEVVEYVENLMSGAEGVEISVEPYHHTQTPFFRMVLKVNAQESPATEVIYGTIINGQMIQFDIYQDGEEDVDETFTKALVDSVRFTKIMTYEEYDAATKKGLTTLMLIVAGVIALIVMAFVLSARKNKRDKNISKDIAAAMQEFRLRRSNDPAAFSKAPFANADTVYSDKAIEEYIVYTTWVKPVIKLAIAAAAFVTIVILMFNAESYAYAIITASIGVVAAYLLYSHSEKQKESLKKQYETKQKKTAHFRFFDEYFTLSGLGSISEYIYTQVTEVRVNKGMIYLYLGNENALIIDSETLSGTTVAELKKKIADARIK